MVGLQTAVHTGLERRDGGPTDWDWAGQIRDQLRSETHSISATL